MTQGKMIRSKEVLLEYLRNSWVVKLKDIKNCQSKRTSVGDISLSFILF
jgi:hypothetical protein